MKRPQLLSAILLILAVTMVWAGTNRLEPNTYGQCLTEEDVQRHLDHSRHGISITCDRDTVQRNLLRRSDQ